MAKSKLLDLMRRLGSDAALAAEFDKDPETVIQRAGLSDEAISHDHTKAMAPLGAAKLERILRRFLGA